MQWLQEQILDIPMSQNVWRWLRNILEKRDGCFSPIGLMPHVTLYASFNKTARTFHAISTYTCRHMHACLYTCMHVGVCIGMGVYVYIWIK